MFLLYGCKGDNATSSNSNPFAGKWNISLSDSNDNGTGLLIIRSDSSFSNTVTMYIFECHLVPCGPWFAKISGSISSSGEITNGTISDGSITVPFTGNFAGNSGSGKYQLPGTGSFGTWSASR